MLPRELNKILTAVNEAKEAHIDVAQLSTELAGTAQFYRALVDKDLLTDQQRVLFAEHVGRHIDWGKGGAPGITAPPQGPPKVHLYITAPKGGAPSVASGGAAGRVKCPNCQHEFIP